MRITARDAVLVSFLSMAGLAQAVADVVEVEPNNPIDDAQSLTIVDGSVAVSARITFGDLDFYRFRAMEKDLLDLKVQRGTTRLSTSMALFDSDFKRLYHSEVGPADAHIEKAHIGKTGFYYVGVTNSPAVFQDGGQLGQTGFPFTGPYTLVISGVSDPIMQMNIDVKPDKRKNARFNPKSKGKVKVALLSSGEFVPALVDQSSLTFGAIGTEKSFSHCNPVRRDLNGDGVVDLICHFDTAVAGFGADDGDGFIRGRMVDGREFEGHGPLKVILPIQPY